MTWTTVTPILVWAGLFIPLAVALWLFRPASKFIAYLLILDYTAANFFFVMTVNWALINYYLRFLCVPIILALLIRHARIEQRRPFFPGKNLRGWAAVAAALAVLAPMIYVNVLVMRSFDYESYYKEDATLVLFPLREGMYVVTNGGNGLYGLGMNDHVKSLFGAPKPGKLNQTYAVDIMKMTIRGSVSSGILPRDYRKYQIFNERVYSPCRGQVYYVEDGHPDVQVGAETTELGNYVVLKCFEWYMTLSNFREGSFYVKAGDPINLGQVIGLVGNSAAPAIPHLHMHVTRDFPDESGPAVPILFELRFSARNAVYIPQ